jgi:histidine phosphotransferase ChpT
MGNDAMHVDLKVAQLLCSRLCHDLVGPAGAVNAGLELLQEDGTAVDALDLAARSGLQTTGRLTFYRMAFGFGGGETVRLGEVRDLAAALVADGAVALDWPVDAAAEGSAIAKGAARLLLNLLLLGVDCLPRGGTLGVRIADLDEGLGIAMTAAGEGARLRPELGAAMARTVQGYYTGCLAADIGAAVEIGEDSAHQVRVATVVPGAVA